MKTSARAGTRLRFGRDPIGRGDPLCAAPLEGARSVLEDGRVEINSNTVERTIRPIKLGAKNHLFAAFGWRGRKLGGFASLIQTAKLNDVEPFAYLRDVLERIVSARPKSTS